MTDLLRPLSRIAVAFITQVLGVTSMGFVLTDEILGLLATLYNPEENSIHVFYYCTYISNNMHAQFINFPNQQTFRY